MQATYALSEAERPLWLGGTPPAWGEVIGGAEGEDVLPLLCFRNGHDGGLAVTISVAPFRLACLNGMLLPIEGAQRTWKARHTANVGTRLTDARRTLGIAWRYYDELEQLGSRLIRQRL